MRSRAKLALGAGAITTALVVALVPLSGVSAATSHLPVGHVDVARVSVNRTVTVAGWAFDPDLPKAATTVDVYVDGRISNRTRTSSRRPDVARVYRSAGPSTGFVATSRPLSYGNHTVCAYGLNLGAGTGAFTLGCRQVALVDPNLPVGLFRAAVDVRSHRATVSGWTFDPNLTARSLTIAVFVNNSRRLVTTANRPDAVLNRRYHITGAHNLLAAVALTYGRSTVCVSVYNVGAGSAATRSLGCVAVNLPAPGPTLNARVATVARQQVGRPYVFGGTTPAGFDCSGLAYYAYRQIGRTLGRDANTQYRQFRAIPQSAARPGDLIFFHAGSYIYHLGIYQGGNMMVAAADYGQGVRYQSIWSPAVTFGTILH